MTPSDFYIARSPLSWAISIAYRVSSAIARAVHFIESVVCSWAMSRAVQRHCTPLTPSQADFMSARMLVVAVTVANDRKLISDAIEAMAEAFPMSRRVLVAHFLCMFPPSFFHSFSHPNPPPALTQEHDQTSLLLT